MCTTRGNAKRLSMKTENLDPVDTVIEVVMKKEPALPTTSHKLSLLEQRMKNIEANSQFLASLELNTVNPAQAPVMVPLVNVKNHSSSKKPKLDYSQMLPRRASERLKNMPPPRADITENEFKFGRDSYISTERSTPHVHFGKLATLDEDSNSLKSCLQRIVESSANQRKESNSAISHSSAEVVAKLGKLKINDTDIAKCCMGRIYDTQFYPSCDKVLLATADKYGNLGFWDVGEKSSTSDCFLTQPHKAHVRCIKFSPSDNSKLFSCSFDGTVKVTDLNKCEFSSIYHASNGNEDSDLHWIDFTSDNNTLCVAENCGILRFIDLRAKMNMGNTSSEMKLLSDEGVTSLTNGFKPVKCVSAHPTKPYLLSSDYISVKIWDLRKPKSVCINDLYHGKVANGAFFSPITGNKILTTCSDDFVRVFDSSTLNVDSIKNTLRAKHDNQTGRWLAPFQAIWHPRCEDVFLIGSMEGHRKLQVYSTESANPALNMFGNDSICCRNAVHPYLDIVAGTTSSGKVFIWR